MVNMILLSCIFCSRNPIFDATFIFSITHYDEELLKSFDRALAEIINSLFYTFTAHMQILQNTAI